MLLALTYSQYTNAQEQGPTADSTKHAALPKKGKNATKVEMIYKRFEVTHYNTRTGSSYTTTVDRPFVHINNSEPITLDKNGQVLEPYLRHCAKAMEEIRQGQAHVRKSRKFGVLMYGVGPAIGLSSVIVAGTTGSNAKFLSLLGIGAGTMMTGVIGKYTHMKRAQTRYEDAITVYNSKCYTGTDTASVAKAAAPTTPTPKGYFRKGEDPYQHDTVKYSSFVSNPMDYTAFGISANPFYLERGVLNNHMGFTIKGFAYLHSFLDLSAEYARAAYADNMGGDATGSGTGQWVDGGYVGPAAGTRKTANSLDIVAAIHLAKKVKNYDYTVKLSRGKLGKVIDDSSSNNIGKQMKSFSIRAGFMSRNLVLEKNSLNDYYDESPTYHRSDYQNTFTGKPVMTKSNIGIVGVALNKISDIDITLKNGKRTGYSKQSTVYLDLLYGLRTTIMDGGYYDAGVGYGQVMTELIPMDQTPVAKVGFRIGAEQIFFRTKHFGMNTGIEVGTAPGPKETSMFNRGYAKGKIGIVFAKRVR